MTRRPGPPHAFRSCVLSLLILTLCACAPTTLTSGRSDATGCIEDLFGDASLDDGPGAPLERMGYSIQVGAFTNLENAVRLENTLEARGIDAYYFRHDSGLFKVRFGNHADYASARSEAEHLRSAGLIGNFFIVIPDSYSVARYKVTDNDRLRAELVKTARGFLGVPYRWGGTDCDNGFDCSGLTMVCYRLNGLNLPRVSRNQFRAGRWIARDKLRKGDLVFFATNGGKRVSHVGMYIGNQRFIHAPSTGKTVRIEKMSHPFFSKTYVGARTYL